jgi:mannosyltransferase
MTTAQPARAAARARLWASARPSAARLLLWLVLAAAGVLSAVLMLIWLGRRSLWFDETVSVEAARLPLGDLVRYLAGTEVNMGLYHLLLAGWLRLGESDAFARSLSVVFGLATLPVAFALARRLFGIPTAVIAVVLLAGNVQLVGHAREARGYSLAVLLVTAAALLLARAVQDDRRLDWALFPLVAALAVYAHLLAAFAVVAQLVSLLVVRPRLAGRRALVAFGAFVALLVPLAASLAANWQGAQIDWLGPPTPRQLPGLFLWFAGTRPVVALYALGVLVAAATAYREWRTRRDEGRSWPYVFLAAVVILPPLAAYVVSFAKPVYLYRYFLVSLPALSVLVAAGLARLGRLWLVVPVVFATAALTTRTTVGCTPGCAIRDDDWRSAAALVRAQALEGDVVLFVPGELRTTFAYYLSEGQRPRLLFPARWQLYGGATEGEATLPAALDRAAETSRIWLVTWWLPDRGVPGRLARSHGAPREFNFDGNVRLRLYGAATS